MLKLYENIKDRRLKLGLTQTQLAEKLGYADKSMIAKIEKGQVDLSQSKIVAFAEALCTTPGELMGWEDDDLRKYNFHLFGSDIDEGQPYYLDPEVAELAQQLYERPEMRVLFDASKDATAEDVQMAADLLNRLSKK